MAGKPYIYGLNMLFSFKFPRTCSYVLLVAPDRNTTIQQFPKPTRRCSQSYKLLCKAG